MTTLDGLAAGLVNLADGDDFAHVIGGAGKTAALDAAGDSLGADRRFSGMRGGRGAALSAGYDVGDPVILKLRPAGLWLLADKGRRRSGTIRPKRARRRGGRRVAVSTPYGPRAVSRFRPSRGLDTLTDAEDEMNRTIPDAIGDKLATKAAQL